MQNSTKRKIPPPPFMQGGKFIADSIVRDTNGYPLDQVGKIDLEATKRETLRYQAAAMNKLKKSNITPPKKRR